MLCQCAHEASLAEQQPLGTAVSEVLRSEVASANPPVRSGNPPPLEPHARAFAQNMGRDCLKIITYGRLFVIELAGNRMDIMMRQQKSTPRSDYRRRERQRVDESVSLSEKFRELKSLTVELAYFSPEGVSRNSQLKYTANLITPSPCFA